MIVVFPDHTDLILLSNSGDSTIKQLIDIENSFCKPADEGKRTSSIMLHLQSLQSHMTQRTALQIAKYWNYRCSSSMVLIIGNKG